jgi:hypothetical protein
MHTNQACSLPFLPTPVSPFHAAEALQLTAFALIAGGGVRTVFSCAIAGCPNTGFGAMSSW